MIESKAREKLSNKDFDSKQLSQQKSYLNKNFPKKLIDQFCDYLVQKTNNSSMKKSMKDKGSWTGLNKLLNGEENIKNVSSQAINKMFIEFLQEYDISKIYDSKVKDEISIVCYKLLIMELKAAAREIEKFVFEKERKTFNLTILK
eukprot:CAMPEP_0176476148 /NCGR_PEP_ID=MMETSP0127-20121128/43989_1 /TAXON_ID=938130 /ORGANISM="Platyophrya macrostoma, Strain WH" /LENGTH=145 /DNA_ID=CAMNT_0017871799 /DNA_START=136 /DNA_END=570 /DNA_ORIENTATION=+